MRRLAAPLVASLALAGVAAARPARRAHTRCDAPGSAVEARVIDVAVHGSSSTFTFDRGTADCVQVGWRGELRSRGRVVPGGAVTIARATRHTASARVAATFDMIPGHLRARLHAP